MVAALFVCVAFLLGSIPSGLILARITTGKDVRQEGSHNIGAANVTRTVGVKVGAAVALLDILKGVIPVLIGGRVGLTHADLALVALAAVLGHDFSLYLRFKGGKGVATTFGVTLVLAPLATVVALAVWVVSLLLTRYASVASLLAVAVIPPMAIVTGRPPEYVVMGCVLFVLAAFKHRGNIVRLAQGTETRTLQRRTANGA